MTGLLVDDRYRGDHGIGRYAQEVLPRLRPEWRSLGLDGSPHTALDAFRALPRVDARALVYSPGYGALVRARRQILTIHDLIQLRSPWPGRMKFAAYYAGPVRHVVRKAGVVLTVSETSAGEIRDWLRDESVRIVNAGNGCSAAFTPTGPATDSADPYVLFVGNVREHKNLDVVMRALPRAAGVRLTVVIPASESAALSARAASLGVTQRLTMFHNVDDARLAALYRGAAVTAMPSRMEGFGLPALESISCGTPVVYWRDCDAVSEIVGERGWALESWDDADEWADALVTACGAGRRIAPPEANRYDWQRTAALISDVLEADAAPAAPRVSTA
ncbi:glycosyltransferase involved in cell wall biosynthesis [Microbacterium terrae]|uniref:glycosyltransferase family 4 protein n=1 Tax=Microbacterium terrae TaxID=69369 RepID=UPI0005EC81B5|nr:glycosyltransferase family 1 protein [Microbacterium terrae]MBP1078308.1 glycosyltransferase involved in cell wall biosynthesis [Microbacterium terrae]GLJ97787.1 glycosyl transferase family 1 [Microbacterium terrae]